MNPNAPHSAVSSACVVLVLFLVLIIRDKFQLQPQPEFGLVRCAQHFLFDDAKRHERAGLEQLISDYLGVAGHGYSVSSTSTSAIRLGTAIIAARTAPEIPSKRMLTLTEAQRPIDGVEVESLRVEGAADPGEHAVMLLMFRVLNGGEKFFVARCAAHVIRWRGACPAGAQRIGPGGVGACQWLDRDPTAPAVTEVIFVGEFANSLAECGFEGLLTLVEHVQ